MNIRTNLLILLLTLFTSVSNTLSSNPTWVNKINYTEAHQIDENEISNGFLYLLYDNQINIDAEEVYLHCAIKVINTNGLSASSTIDIAYDKNYQNLTHHYVKIIRDGKVIDVLARQKPETIRRETRLERGIIDGMLTSYLEVKDLRVGDILEYAYTIKGFNPIKDGLFHTNYSLNYSIPVGANNLMIQTTEPSKYEYLLLNDAPKPKINIKGNATQYTWYLNQPELVDYEMDAPAWHSPYQQVVFSSKLSWAELAKHISQLYSTQQPLSKEITNYIRNIKNKNTSNEEKALEVVRFVQNDIRYLGNEDGIYSFKPRSPNQIFNNRAGDCKEKSWLLASLLQQLGYEAYPALVNTYLAEKIAERPVGYESFDHCITCAISGSDTIFIDPTVTNQGGNFKNNLIFDYGYALLVRPSSSKLTPIDANLFYETKIKEEFNIDDYSGKATLNVTTVYKGYDAEINREYFINSSLKDIQDQYLQFYASSYPRIDTLKLLSYQDDISSNTFTVKESYNIDNIWVKEDSLQSKITASFGASSLNYELNRTNYPERKSPMWLKHPSRYRQEIILNLPEEWNISNSKSSIYGPGFNYYNNVVQKDNQIHLSYDYQTTSNVVEASEYADFIEKNTQVSNDLWYEVYNYDDSTTAGSGALNFQFILIILFTCVIGTYFAVKLYKYDTEPRVNPDLGRKLGGWLVLVSIGVTLTPIVLLYFIIDLNYFDTQSWSYIFNPSSPDYSLELGIFIIIEMMFNFLFLIFSVLNVILLYQRRTIFPKVFIGYILLNFLFLFGDAAAGVALNVGEFDTETTLDLFKRIVSICIWVPYLLISERSKETFVRQLKPNYIKTDVNTY